MSLVSTFLQYVKAQVVARIPPEIDAMRKNRSHSAYLLCESVLSARSFSPEVAYSQALDIQCGSSGELCDWENLPIPYRLRMRNGKTNHQPLGLHLCRKCICRTALLRKSKSSCTSPFPRRIYARGTVTGVPRWVKRLSSAALI